MKNKELKNLITITIIIFIIMIFISIIFSSQLLDTIKLEILKNNSSIVSNLIEKHPDLESDIVDSIILKGDYEKGNSILLKYNFDKNVIDISSIQNKLIIINLSILLLGLGLIFIINILFIINNYRKIKKIDKYMNDVLNGNYKINIKDYLEGDISNLKNDIYKMTVLLREQSELLLSEKKYLEELLEDISHQIKTPLTSMHLINDVLEKEKDEKLRKEFLIKNKNQLLRLEWLITSLLKISRLDNGSIKFKYENVKISSLISKAIEPINEMIEVNNIKLKLNIKNTDIYVDFNWTKEAILNIIKNALEHTKDEIIISSSVNPLYTDIKITDNGCGITKKDLPHIFERFYKGDHNKDSIGIGLNMSKKIIEQENGIIEVQTKEGKGTTFILKFYKM